MGLIAFKRNLNTVATVRTDDGSSQQKELMSKDILALSFSSPVPLDLRMNDYVQLFNQRYNINQEVPLVKNSSRNFSYALQLEAEWYNFGKVEYLFYGSNNILRETDFSLMGTLRTFGELMITNMNRIYPGVWSLGTVEDTDTENMTFSQDNCLTALGKAADQFKTEYFFEGNVLHIYKRDENSGITMQYGRGNGLYNLQRTNADQRNIVTRLYAYGGTQNLPTDYRGGATRVQLPNAYYIEQNTDLFGTIEGVQVFENDFPKRVGTITGLVADDPLSFVDSAIDFNVNSQLVGTSAMITFNTGLMAGYQFSINNYNDITKTFRINQYKSETGFILPNDALNIQPGDQYVITGIAMPQSYVDNAEQQVLTDALDYMADNSSPRMTYAGEIDRLVVRKNNLVFTLGTRVRIIDADLGVDRQIRITATNRDVNYPDQWSFTLADTLTSSILTRVIADQRKTANVITINRLTDVNRARRNWRDTLELEGMVFDTEGHYYSEKIKPLSIETTMLAVAARSQQFTLNGIVFSPNYQSDAQKFFSTAGTLVNFSIGDLPVTWNIAAASYFNLVAGTPYYIYAKCQKTGNTGTILLSTEQITIDQDAAYYHFLIGVLHSDQDAVRGISLTYGQTTINGKFITTGVITSTDGLTYFNLDQGIIGGKIAFTAGSSGYANLIDKPDLSIYAVQSFVDAALSGLQSQIDGQIETWFYDGVPTLYSEPAVEWLDDTTRDTHLGDLYFDTQTQYAYRFAKISGVYSWEVVKDTDITLALANAAKAQDTADHKRRVFVAQPTTPYDAGDLWSQGAGGDLMRCINSRISGAFNATDWSPASKYTDDTAANAAQVAANIAQQAADDAQADANTANQVLANIANDNLLAVSEKPTVLQDWQIIQGEKPVIDAQADTYAINHDHYDTAYTSLSDYVSPLLSDMTVDSVIDGPTFRAKFKAYSDEKVNLLKLISDSAKAKADAAKAAADAAATTAATAVANAQNAQDTADAAHAITSYLFTTIEGNVIATGTLLVGDAVHNNAGLSGVTDNGAQSVRFFAGAAFADRNDAPFRVYDSGDMYAISGMIGSWKLNSEGLFNDQNAACYIKQRVDYGVSGDGNYTEIFVGLNPSETSATLGRFFNNKVSPYPNTALALSASNGTLSGPFPSGNVALAIVEGDIVVGGVKTYTGRIGYSLGTGVWEATIEKGLFIRTEQVA